jgi:hypothetical protein
LELALTRTIYPYFSSPPNDEDIRDDGDRRGLGYQPSPTPTPEDTDQVVPQDSGRN